MKTKAIAIKDIPESTHRKPILIRKVRRSAWQKFREICDEEEISANTGVKTLIYRAVRRGTLIAEDLPAEKARLASRIVEIDKILNKNSQNCTATR